MRILHVVASLSGRWGGPVAVLSQLVPELSRSGIHNTVLAPEGFRSGAPEVPIAGAEVRTTKAGPPARLWPGYSRDLAARCER